MPLPLLTQTHLTYLPKITCNYIHLNIAWHVAEKAWHGSSMCLLPSSTSHYIPGIQNLLPPFSFISQNSKQTHMPSAHTCLAVPCLTHHAHVHACTHLPAFTALPPHLPACYLHTRGLQSVEGRRCGQWSWMQVVGKHDGGAQQLMAWHASSTGWLPACCCLLLGEALCLSINVSVYVGKEKLGEGRKGNMCLYVCIYVCMCMSSNVII